MDLACRISRQGNQPDFPASCHAERTRAGLSRLRTYSSSPAAAVGVCDGGVVVAVPLGASCVTDGDGDTGGEGDTLGTDGEGCTPGDSPGRGAVGRALERVDGTLRVDDLQVLRCRSAIHAGMPRAIASSGQVKRYIEMSRSVRQRPSRNDTQYGSPECSLAITAQPLPQSMMREPLSG